MTDERPANCRNRLRDEGFEYPRSGCARCGTGGMTGCPYESSMDAGSAIDVPDAPPQPGSTEIVGSADFNQWWDNRENDMPSWVSMKGAAMAGWGAAVEFRAQIELPWRLGDIKRGLILFRTSSNAHGATNVSILSEKVRALPQSAKDELAGMMRNIAEELSPANPPLENDLLSPGERAVINALVSAWNAIVALPGEHPDDITEFRHAIHHLQEKILARPTRRALMGGEDIRARFKRNFDALCAEHKMSTAAEPPRPSPKSERPYNRLRAAIRRLASMKSRQTIRNETVTAALRAYHGDGVYISDGMRGDMIRALEAALAVQKEHHADLVEGLKVKDPDTEGLRAHNHACNDAAKYIRERG